MKINVKITIRIILCAAGMAAMLVLAGIAGMHMERSRQEAAEMRKEHVSEIAVVNMDDGVIIEDSQINYASQLMSLPGDNFTVTGLTDARGGIESGIYAAYIVIPETFSASVTSLEKEPKKVMLNYRYNAKLDEESRLQAMEDVNAFISLLDSNISYMYVDAVMDEFHRVQDDSETILSNDNAELELLAGVDAMELIAGAEPVEEILVEDDIEPVELGSYTEQNNSLLGSLRSGYAEAAQKGKDDYTPVQETRTEVEKIIDSFSSTYHAVIEDTASGQEEILETGRSSLEEAVGVYNQDIDEKKEEAGQLAEEIAGGLMEQNQAEADRQLEELRRKADQNLRTRLGYTGESTEQPLENIAVDAYMQGLYDALGVLESDIEQSGISTAEDVRKKIEDYKSGSTLQDREECRQEIENLKAGAKAVSEDIYIDWEALKSPVPDISGNDIQDGGNPDAGGDKAWIFLGKPGEGQIAELTEKILKLFKMEAGSDEVNDVIQTYFVDALLEKGEEQMSRLSDAEQELTQSMDEYESRLTEYDPLKYIESADLEAYLDDINMNAGEMLDAVEQNNSEYMLYASDMFTATTEHSEELAGALDEANAQTTENVENCINGLISSRETVNGQNVSLLGGFTDSLTYTRVGSRGNPGVYDHIINPVISQDNSQGAAKVETMSPAPEKEGSARTWLIIVLGAGILLSLMEVFLYFREQYKKPREETEDVLM